MPDSRLRTGFFLALFPRRVGGGSEAGAVAEEAAEVGGVGKAQMVGDGAGCPAGAVEDAAFVDHPPCSGAGGGLCGAGERADRAAEQAGVVVRVVQFAEVQFQRVEELSVDRGAPSSAAGGGRRGGGVGAVGEAEEQGLQQAAPQGVVEVEGAPSQGTVLVEGLEGGALGPGRVVGVRGQDGGRVVCRVTWSTSWCSTAAGGRPLPRPSRPYGVPAGGWKPYSGVGVPAGDADALVLPDCPLLIIWCPLPAARAA